MVLLGMILQWLTTTHFYHCSITPGSTAFKWTETGGNLPKPPNKLSIRQHCERTGNVAYTPILPVTQNLMKSFLTEANKN